MATFLLAHGAWSAGWPWKKLRPLLRAGWHELFTPTHTGRGERARHEGWGNCEIDASRNPHITVPEALATLLQGTPAGRAIA